MLTCYLSVNTVSSSMYFNYLLTHLKTYLELIAPKYNLVQKISKNVGNLTVRMLISLETYFYDKNETQKQF